VKWLFKVRWWQWALLFSLLGVAYQGLRVRTLTTYSWGGYTVNSHTLKPVCLATVHSYSSFTPATDETVFDTWYYGWAPEVAEDVKCPSAFYPLYDPNPLSLSSSRGCGVKELNNDYYIVCDEPFEEHHNELWKLYFGSVPTQ
jgi:hypothetical protein